MEKLRGFRGLLGDREAFQAKHFRSSFKLEYHGRTLQEENRTINAMYSWLSAINNHVSTQLARCAGAGYTLCDFQLDIILQPHCLAISAKVRKRQVKRYIYQKIITQMRSINEIAYACEHF